MSVRLAYFDAVTDIEAEYYELREKMTRDDTLARLAEAHADELYDPDQNAFFWVAIGKAQSKYKEVTGDAAEKAKAGLEGYPPRSTETARDKVFRLANRGCICIQNEERRGKSGLS